MLSLPADLKEIVDPHQTGRPEELTVACYTFPSWHANPYNDRLYGKGWTEYIQMRGCQPWFPGHNQPRTPLLGELDERLPSTWEKYNELAHSAGIDVFIFDWYWFRGGPVFHEALEDGFLQAANVGDMKFAVCYVNHPWAIWYPTAGFTPEDDYTQAWETSGLGGYEVVDEAPHAYADIWRGLAYIVSRYFHHPQYWRLDGAPVLPIWDFSRIVRELGEEGTKHLLSDLREFARKLGHPNIYVHIVCQEVGVIEMLPNLNRYDVQSYGVYNAVAMATGMIPDEIELMQYGQVAGLVATRVWPEFDARTSIPGWPNLNPGCDNAPRVLRRPRPEKPSRAKWPGTPIVINETPAAFEALLRAALGYLNMHPIPHNVLTIGCWNEWTEGHYLLPDTRHGFGMLRAMERALLK